MSNTYSVVFLFLFFFRLEERYSWNIVESGVKHYKLTPLAPLYCQFLWILLFLLSLRYSLTFICNLLVLIALYIFFNWFICYFDELYLLLKNIDTALSKLLLLRTIFTICQTHTSNSNVSELCDLCCDNVKLYTL